MFVVVVDNLGVTEAAGEREGVGEDLGVGLDASPWVILAWDTTAVGVENWLFAWGWAVKTAVAAPTRMAAKTYERRLKYQLNGLVDAPGRFTVSCLPPHGYLIPMVCYLAHRRQKVVADVLALLIK